MNLEDKYTIFFLQEKYSLYLRYKRDIPTL